MEQPEIVLLDTVDELLAYASIKIDEARQWAKRGKNDGAIQHALNNVIFAIELAKMQIVGRRLYDDMQGYCPYGGSDR